MDNDMVPGEHESVPEVVSDELDFYEQQIRRYRSGELGETKMQKQRLHFGTYAQRQEGVQMQRIKIPGGRLSSDQLACIAGVADEFGSGLIHFTTREDAQVYYVKLEEVPALLRRLAQAGITTREACGNTVRNITCCYRAGTARDEVFDVGPYADGLFRYLVRNKYNQNLGRKFKIAFEGCAEDHSRLGIHDIGLAARLRRAGPERGFQVWLGGGLGAAPHAARLYTDFLPEAELLNLVVSTLRVFDRYGERKSRMKARLKFLVQTLGWNRFVEELDLERLRVGLIPLPEHVKLPQASAFLLPEAAPELRLFEPERERREFQRWARDSVVEHRVPGLRGVHVRLKLGDITAELARGLAEAARRFSMGELRVSIEQNFYLPWVRTADLPDLHRALSDLGLADHGAETVEDVTTCPGADTCRLGIASAKGLGSALSEAFREGELSGFLNVARPLRIKISGCPNACAQHSTADIGFQAAALNQDGRTVPAYLVFAGGKVTFGEAGFGAVIGRIPARNGVAAVKALLELYGTEKRTSEDFQAFVNRVGHGRLKETLEPVKGVPAHQDDPSFYQDWGHQNERFTVRQGIRGECAGSTVAESVPAMEMAREWLAQAEAYLHHEAWESAVIAAYEAAAHAARVPLYARLVDPFTSEEALWEFENLFVLSGQTPQEWQGVSERFERLKSAAPAEEPARETASLAKEFVAFCASMGVPGEPTAHAMAGAK
jgi:sulfite reductase (ferredoxin)